MTESQTQSLGVLEAPLPPPPQQPGPEPARPRRGPGRLATAVIAAVVAAAVSAGMTTALREEPTPAAAPVEQAPATTGQSSDGSSLSIADIAAAVAPSVASVEVSSGFASGEGTGVVFRSDGYIVTNHHVVASGGNVTVTLPDGTRHDAEVVGSDATSDLAVLRIDADGLPAASFAGELPRVGETTVAIGSPFGLEGSVSAGIVSALDRVLPTGDATLIGLIQTDAAINPGNSGGPLVNDRGEVIGINTAILSRSGANDGVGFAVPAPTVTHVAEQLIGTGTVRWAQLGVRGQDVNAQVAEAYDLATDEGALIGEVVSGSAADAAGLRAGDIVVGLDDREITSMSDLAAAVREHQPGDQIALAVLRDGERLSIDVTLDIAR